MIRYTDIAGSLMTASQIISLIGSVQPSRPGTFKFIAVRKGNIEMEYKQLFDVVISVAADPYDRLKYLVMIFNQLNGSSNEVLAQAAFDSSGEALDWARLALEAFKGDAIRDRKPAPA